MTRMRGARNDGVNVRVRFCPSPTGTPHVGAGPHRAVQPGLRPAHRRDSFVFRIEDADAACDSERELRGDPRRAAMAWLAEDGTKDPVIGGPCRAVPAVTQRSESYQGRDRASA